ncbi:hypothetical protein MUK42_27343 [Musa troglodytarum]|uniref:Uncharacterized protein n=1 Tax=Musa troglodytarum TaxID=320322 RepID=A0A9E7EZM7_9LILI|nr:hypothetical protein MUK42_27343 [Musa troglodytarum]
MSPTVSSACAAPKKPGTRGRSGRLAAELGSP